jgi:TolA-binding protein
MGRECRFLLLAWALLCSVLPVRAASSAEDRAYRSASDAFRLHSWDYAEKKYGEFVQKFPDSDHLPETILFQAEARYRLGNLPGTISLLSNHIAAAGMWADEYLYWISQAQFSAGDYEAAAKSFASLIQRYPDSLNY